MIELFLSAFLLGLLFNAMPGAILAESLRRGLRGGFAAAFAVQIGSLAGDLTWAVLGLMGAAALVSLPYIETPLALGGAALLVWIAWQALADAMSPMPAFEPADGRALDSSALATGVAMSLSNPLNVTYWAALGGTVTALGAAEPGWRAFTIFLAGFMTSSVLWCFICAGLIAWTRQRLSPAGWRLLNFGCAAGIAYFAFSILWRIVGG